MNLLNQHFNKIVIGLLLLMFVQQCSSLRRLGAIEKSQKQIAQRLEQTCTSKEVKTAIEIEGLKAEKRMIQSTDRTMLDVNRQSQIDTILKRLEQ